MIPMIGTPVALACVTQDGYLCFVYHDVPTPWFLEVQNGSTREQASYSELFRKPTTTKGVSPNVIGFSFGGLTVRRSTVVFVISFRHYLIVTIFALFYGVLKWVYWKRGKVVADE